MLFVSKVFEEVFSYYVLWRTEYCFVSDEEACIQKRFEIKNADTG